LLLCGFHAVVVGTLSGEGVNKDLSRGGKLTEGAIDLQANAATAANASLLL
jgi:hypothetical protein